MFTASEAHLLRLRGGHTHGGSGLLGEVEAGAWRGPEGTRRAGRSMDRAVEEKAGRDRRGKEFAAVRERRGEGKMKHEVRWLNAVLSGTLLVSSGTARAQETQAAPTPGPVVIQEGGVAGTQGGPGPVVIQGGMVAG